MNENNVNYATFTQLCIYEITQHLRNYAQDYAIRHYLRNYVITQELRIYAITHITQITQDYATFT